MVGSMPAPSLQEKERTLFSEHINSPLAQLPAGLTVSVCVCGSFSGQTVCWTAVKCLPVQPLAPEVITPQYRPQHVDTNTHNYCKLLPHQSKNAKFS